MGFSPLKLGLEWENPITKNIWLSTVAQSVIERERLSLPYWFFPMTDRPLSSAFSSNGGSLSPIYAQPASLALSFPLSSSSSLWPPPSPFPSLFLHGRPTGSEPPEDCHRTRAIGGKPKDSEVVVASSVRGEASLLEVVEARDDVQTQVSSHFRQWLLAQVHFLSIFSS